MTAAAKAWDLPQSELDDIQVQAKELVATLTFKDIAEIERQIFTILNLSRGGDKLSYTIAKAAGGTLLPLMHARVRQLLGADAPPLKPGSAAATAAAKETDNRKPAEPERPVVVELLEAYKAALADRYGGDDPCCDKDPITVKLRRAIARANGGAA